MRWPWSKETRSNDSSWWNLFDNLFSNKSTAGVNVTPQVALTSSAVYACIRVLAESIASLPIGVFKRNDDGSKEPFEEHSLHKLLKDGPNPQQTSFEFRELFMTHLGLRGNSYSFKERNGANQLSGLIPLNPARTTVRLEKGELVFEFTPEDISKPTIILKQDEVWHLKGLSTDGFLGLSPITVARDAIGLAIATQEHGTRLFSNGVQPGIVLEHPGNLSEKAGNRLRKSFEKTYKGNENAFKTMILEEEMKVKTVGFSNDDSQFLETRNFQVEDIARIYRVPSVLIGHPDATQTFASAEQFFLSFVVHTIRPWAERIEQSMEKNLLSDKDRADGVFVEFNLNGLLRGDIKTRFEAFEIAIRNEWMSPNEVRKLENMNPRDGGDEFANPNTKPAEPVTESTEEPEEEDEDA